MTQIKRVFLSTYKNLVDFHFFQVANASMNIIFSNEQFGSRTTYSPGESFNSAVAALNDALFPEWDSEHKTIQQKLKDSSDFHGLYQQCVALAIRRKLLRNRKVVAITSVLSKSPRE